MIDVCLPQIAQIFTDFSPRGVFTVKLSEYRSLERRRSV
jgi:hypothetical protein